MKLKIILISIFVALYGMFFYINTQTKYKRIDLIQKEHIKQLQIHYELTMNYFIQDVTSIRDNITHNKKAIQIFKDAQNAKKDQLYLLRAKLYKLLLPMYKRIHSRGILQWQFVFPNNISFLRMHKPSKFGDDLTQVRYSFKQANKTKKTIVGFEKGRVAHGFRYVFPFYDEFGNHLGAVEISLGSEFLQKKLLIVNKIHSHFIINKRIFKVKNCKRANEVVNYIQSVENIDYVYAPTILNNKDKAHNIEKKILTLLRDDISRGIALGKAFSLYTPYKDTIKVITFLPIRNIKKEISAFLVAYTDDKNIYSICKDYKRNNILVFFVLLVLFYFIYRNFNYKRILEDEVKQKTKKLKENRQKLKILNANLKEQVSIEVRKNRKKDQQLLHQSKLAQMGEMISMIAHQWRQPLNAISLTSSNLSLKCMMDDVDVKYFQNELTLINKYSQHLSSTIDDFRGFFKEDREKKVVTLKELVDSTLDIVRVSVENKNIKILTKFNSEEELKIYANELKQVILNLVKNAEDILIERKVKNGQISIEVNKKVLTVRDNGGGISKDIIKRIFEPYFSTKLEKDGTGLGLYMSKIIVEEHCNGRLSVSNDTQGAVFRIEL